MKKSYDQLIAETVKNVNQKLTASRTKKKSKGNFGAYITVWQDAMRTAYPDTPIMAKTINDLSVLKKFMRVSNPECDYTGFITFCVLEWKTITSSGILTSYKRVPLIPSISVLFSAYNFNLLYEYWQQCLRGEATAARNTLPATTIAANRKNLSSPPKNEIIENTEKQLRELRKRYADDVAYWKNRALVAERALSTEEKSHHSEKTASQKGLYRGKVLSTWDD